MKPTMKAKARVGKTGPLTPRQWMMTGEDMCGKFFKQVFAVHIVNTFHSSSRILLGESLSTSLLCMPAAVGIVSPPTDF